MKKTHITFEVTDVCFCYLFLLKIITKNIIKVKAMIVIKTSPLKSNIIILCKIFISTISITSLY